MPTEVIRNGKTYIEYSPQDLAKARLEREINYMEKHGVRNTAGSMFDSTHTTNPSRLKKKHGI